MEANYFTILWWFCHTLTWISHGYTCVPHPEPPSHLSPHTIPLGHLGVPAPSILYHASNLDWRFISHVIIYMFQCHSPISSHPRSLPESKRLFYTPVSFGVSHTGLLLPSFLKILTKRIIWLHMDICSSISFILNECNYNLFLPINLFFQNGTPLQYSCLENSMGRGAWQATVSGVAESDTAEWLSVQWCF